MAYASLVTSVRRNRSRTILLAERQAGANLASMLPDEQTSSEQIAVFRRMTPEQHWHAAYRLYWTMRRHKAAFMRSQHPEWPEARVEAEVREIFSHIGSHALVWKLSGGG